jgi:hypothetical protein
MLRRTMIMFSALAAFTATLGAQGKTNFSGTWTLNLSKSDFGMLAAQAPTSRTDVISHADTVVKVETTQEGAQGKNTSTSTFYTDGQESTNKLGPMEVKSTMKWDGPKLVQTAKLDFNGNEVTIKGIWTLSADGSTLTQDNHFTSGMGEFDQKMVFEKSGGAVASASAAPAAKATTGGGAKTDFSGIWKLNVAKSDFGPVPPPNSRTDIIDHKDPSLKVATNEDGANGKQDYVLMMTTDGKEATNTPGGLELKSTAAWEGPSLIVNTKLKFQDNDVAIKATWQLSPDGKVLTETSHYTTAMGEFDAKAVYERQ